MQAVQAPAQPFFVQLRTAGQNSQLRKENRRENDFCQSPSYLSGSARDDVPGPPKWISSDRSERSEFHHL